MKDKIFVEIGDMALELNSIVSLAGTLHDALDYGHNGGDPYVGAANILYMQLFDFQKKLEELSCQE